MVKETHDVHFGVDQSVGRRCNEKLPSICGMDHINTTQFDVSLAVVEVLDGLDD